MNSTPNYGYEAQISAISGIDRDMKCVGDKADKALGFEAFLEYGNVFYKNPFNEVGVSASIAREGGERFGAGGLHAVAILPEGFRPRYQVDIPGFIRISGSTTPNLYSC